MKSQKLINFYNATSTIDPDTGDIESIEVWMEKHLLDKLEKLDKAQKKYEELKTAAVDVRFNQQQYFKTRRQEWLQKSKQTEQKLDQLLIADITPKLNFDDV